MFCQPTYVHSLPSPPTTPEPLGYRNAGANAAPYHHPVQYNEFGVRSPFAAPRAPPSPPPTLPIPPEARLGTFIGAGRLRFDRIIGSGAYGTVYLAVDVTTGKQVAVKTLNKYNDDGSLKDQLNASYQAREIRLHFDASAHPNVVSILNIIETPDCIHVVLEYCPDGDLFYNIVVLGRYEGDDALVRRSFLQILEAVMFCHSLGIYHRDLKPENILVTDQGNTIKLADFGLASNLPHSADYGCGSEFYMSPECLDRSSHRTSYLCAPNDVWSLGVILVNLTCRRNPWKLASPEDASYRAFTYNPEFLKTILPISDELNQILGRIFTHDPAHRITLPELRKAILGCPRFTNRPLSEDVAPQVLQDEFCNTFDQVAPMPAPEFQEAFQEATATMRDDDSDMVLMDDSDDSDDSDVSDTFSVSSDQSGTSTDGVEYEEGPAVAAKQAAKFPPSVVSLGATPNDIPEFTPQPQRFLQQHVPSLRNNVHQALPTGSHTAAGPRDNLGQGPSGQGFNPYATYFNKPCAPQGVSSLRLNAPMEAPAPAPATRYIFAPGQGFCEQVLSSVPQIWRFLGPQGNAFHPHLPHLAHLPVRTCLG